MELQDYIATGLVQICRGIAKAQKELAISSEQYTIIAPALSDSKARAFVTFDITCTVRQETSGNAKAGTQTGSLLEVVGLSAKANGEISRENSNANIQKISFDVPFAPHLICELEGANKCKN